MSKKKERSGGIGKWFREMKSELKKVVWPTLPQVIKNTAIVLVMALVVAAIVGVLDFGFNQGVVAVLPDEQPAVEVPVDMPLQPVTEVPVEQPVTEVPVEQPTQPVE